MRSLARKHTAIKQPLVTNKNGQMIVDRKELTQKGHMVAEKREI